MPPVHGTNATRARRELEEQQRRRRRHRTPAGAAPLHGRTLPNAAFNPATPPARADSTFGYATVQLPPGSRVIRPVQTGDQGISANERPHAEVAIKRLFEAGGVDMIAFYDAEANAYELRSRTGMVRWQRWTTPSGELRYVVTEQRGENPIPSVDGTVLNTLEQEVAAAGGTGKPVPKEKNSYPDILQRLTQLWDDRRAPDFVYIPSPGGDPNHPGAGSHGIPDMVQSRAPLVIAGPGIKHGAVSDALVRHEDVAPTVADLLGVHAVQGTNASGVQRTQLLKWQDGKSLTSAISGARQGALYGAAQRAVVFAIDGLSQTVLLDEIKKGNLPNLARLVARGTLFRNGTLSEYPNVTWANHNTLVTGAAPGHSGIVNNSWYDRETQTEQLITDGGFKNVLRTGRLIDPQVETLYEAVERSFADARTVAINQPSGRGADISVLDLVGVGGILRHIAKIGVEYLKDRRVSDREYESLEGWKGEAIKDSFASALGQALWGAKDVPKLGVFEFTLVDNRGHLVGPHTEDARRALREVDRKIGKVLDTIEKRGIADSTAFVLTADHGMEHQYTEPEKLGGWFEALDRAAADGARTKESTRFVYVHSVQWAVEGAVPKAGTTGELAIKVVNDDQDAQGTRPAVAGATVTVRDADGHEWSAVTDAEGRIKLPVSPTRGPLQVTIEHTDFSVEKGSIPLPG
ncbi:MAG: alkaline phosphatase family protein [Thermoleophilia bacterium]|nr:alkaline phosphatase family protein [Thermoleophilia bacterium]